MAIMSNRPRPLLSWLLLLVLLHAGAAPAWALPDPTVPPPAEQSDPAAHAHHHHHPAAAPAKAADPAEPADPMHCEVTCEHCIGHCVGIHLHPVIDVPDPAASAHSLAPADLPRPPVSVLYRPPIL